MSSAKIPMLSLTMISNIMLLLLSVLGIISIPVVTACSCLALSPQSIADQAYANAQSAIFVGTIESRTTASTSNAFADVNATLLVSAAFKQPMGFASEVIPGGRFNVSTGPSSASCGLTFNVGEQWFLTAVRNQVSGGFNVDLCGFNCLERSSASSSTVSTNLQCRTYLAVACSCSTGDTSAPSAAPGSPPATSATSVGMLLAAAMLALASVL